MRSRMQASIIRSRMQASIMRSRMQASIIRLAIISTRYPIRVLPSSELRQLENTEVSLALKSDALWGLAQVCFRVRIICRVYFTVYVKLGFNKLVRLVSCSFFKSCDRYIKIGAYLVRLFANFVLCEVQIALLIYYKRKIVKYIFNNIGNLILNWPKLLRPFKTVFSTIQVIFVFEQQFF